MTDEANPDYEQETDDNPLVTPADFRSVDYNAIVQALNTAFYPRLRIAFMDAAAANQHIEPQCSVYRLLGSICGLHLRVDDRANVFGDRLSTGDIRTPIPEDWRGEQSTHFHEILEEIEHPALRARLADIAWLNDRKKGDAAAIAIASYCDCVKKLADGTFEVRYTSERHVSMEEVDYIERASQIHWKTKKRLSPVSPQIAALLESMYGRALQNIDVAPLKRISPLLERFSLISWDQLATDMETAAETAQEQQQVDILAIKELWDLAAYAHAQAKRPEDQRRCQLASVNQTLRMAPQTGSSLTAAHWYRKAIGELRHISGTEAQREELSRELRSLQEKLFDEMGSFETSIDLSDEISGTIEVFEHLTLPDALRQFAWLAVPNNAAAMREEAAQPDGFFSSMFSTAYHDTDGKLITEVEGDPMDGSPPNEKRIKAKMVRHLETLIELVVKGRLEPARRLISGGFPISERHFRSIVALSPFVPRHHKATFALGFARLIQGDCLSAGPILIPQLENSLRHVLLNSSTDTSKMRNDLTQEDRSLSTLLDGYRDELVQILGEDIGYPDYLVGMRERKVADKLNPQRISWLMARSVRSLAREQILHQTGDAQDQQQ